MRFLFGIMEEILLWSVSLGTVGYFNKDMVLKRRILSNSIFEDTIKTVNLGNNYYSVVWRFSGVSNPIRSKKIQPESISPLKSDQINDPKSTLSRYNSYEICYLCCDVQYPAQYFCAFLWSMNNSIWEKI